MYLNGIHKEDYRANAPCGCVNEIFLRRYEGYAPFEQSISTFYFIGKSRHHKNQT